MAPTPWQKSLNKGSFRGVPFFIGDTNIESGRRLSVFEFPLREYPLVEDLGRKVERYNVNCYVLINPKKPNYMDDRNKLKVALALPGIGTLVHPYYGEHQVYIESYTMEEKRDEGGIAYFQITFINTKVGAPGGVIKLAASVDTAKGLIARALDTIASVKAYFVAAYDQTGISSFLQSVGLQNLNLLNGNITQQLISGLTTGGGILAPLANAYGALGNISSNITNSINVAESILSVFSAYTTQQGQVAQATTISNRLTAASPTIAPFADYSRTGLGAAPITDITLGLTALASWGNDLPDIAATTPQRAQEAANQAVLRQLVQVAALASIAQILSQIEYANAQEATAHMNALLAFLAIQTDAAANAGQDQLFLALGNLAGAVVADMTTRASNLPQITPYHVNGNLPSLALSQRLYQSASNDQALVGLNLVAHPLFMGRDGEYLAAA